MKACNGYLEKPTPKNRPVANVLLEHMLPSLATPADRVGLDES